MRKYIKQMCSLYSKSHWFQKFHLSVFQTHYITYKYCAIFKFKGMYISTCRRKIKYEEYSSKTVK